MKTVLTTLILGVLAIGGLSADTNESTRGVALVVGNADYLQVTPLANPGNDAEDIATVLTNLKWDVILVKNAKLNEFRKALREFGKKLNGQKVGLFYYAGHGVQVDGENYLVPVDADFEDNTDISNLSISADVVMRTLDESKVPIKILVLDACRNNPFEKTRALGGGTRGLVPVQSAAAGTILVYATSPNNVSQDGSARNGIFTGAFLENLKIPGIDFQEIFDRTAQIVSSETGGKQNPWMNKSFYGKLYFVGPAEAQAIADNRLAELKAAQEKLNAEIEERAKAIEIAKTETEKNDLILAQRKDQALALSQKEEKAALERSKSLAEARAIEEHKNKDATDARSAAVEAQLASLRLKIEGQRKASEDSFGNTDEPYKILEKIRSIDQTIVDIQSQFRVVFDRRISATMDAWNTRETAINKYQMDPWEDQCDLDARKLQAATLATRDRDNEVGSLKANFAQAMTKQTSDLFIERDGLKKSLVDKEWLLSNSDLSLSRGDYDRTSKTWPLTVICSKPTFTKSITYQLAHSSSDELKLAYTSFDMAWKAGAYICKALYKVEESQWPGYWREKLTKVEVIDLTKNNTVVTSADLDIPFGWVGGAPPNAEIEVTVPREAEIWMNGKEQAKLVPNQTWTLKSDTYGQLILESRYSDGDTETVIVDSQPGQKVKAIFVKNSDLVKLTDEFNMSQLQYVEEYLTNNEERNEVEKLVNLKQKDKSLNLEIENLRLIAPEDTKSIIGFAAQTCIPFFPVDIPQNKDVLTLNSHDYWIGSLTGVAMWSSFISGMGFMLENGAPTGNCDANGNPTYYPNTTSTSGPIFAISLSLFSVGIIYEIFHAIICNPSNLEEKESELQMNIEKNRVEEEKLESSITIPGRLLRSVN